METVERWGVYEIGIKGPVDDGAWWNPGFSARFTHENGQVLEVPGFYDGDGRYRVRFMPSLEGKWRYRTAGPIGALGAKEGEFVCGPANAGNHGPVGVRDVFHFAYADGTPHRSFGTTCYAWIHMNEALQEETLRTLRTAPFNKMRMCVFPKDYSYCKDEPALFPFPRGKDGKWDLRRFDPAFWAHLERRVLDLGKLGIEADLILFHPYDRWGFSSMPAEVDDAYLRYAVARLSAFRNVWWSMANEFDFMKSKKPEDWDRFFQVVRDSDPYGRLRSIHNGAVFYDHGKPWVTHCSVQRAEPLQSVGWRERYRKPVVIDECQYEGDIPEGWGNISAAELVHRFWLAVASGAYAGHGETYLDPKDLLWWSKGGRLRGESPARIAFLRRIVESLDGPLTPRHRWDYYYAATPGGSLLLYLDAHQPKVFRDDLPDGRRYRVTLLDPWAMTETDLGTHQGRVELSLPVRPRQALLFRAE